MIRSVRSPKFIRPYLLSLLLVVGAPALGADMTVAVDPRVELACIVFRLAGLHEYNEAPDSPYLKAVVERFSPLAEHPAVLEARRLNAEAGLGYNAPVEIALYLEDGGDFGPAKPLDPVPAALDDRWSATDAVGFAGLLRDFAKDSDYAGFLKEQAPYQEASAGRLREALADSDFRPWFEEFFGVGPEVAFYAVPALLTGSSCYGPRVERPGGGQDLYYLQGVWQVDDQGLPEFSPDTGVILVHEFCHSFVNPVADRYESELASSGDKILPGVAQVMAQQAYSTWQIVVYESVVRACTARYLADTRGPDSAAGMIRSDQGKGFTWMPDLVAVLDGYRPQADKSRGFAEFFPEIVAFFDEYAAGLPEGPPPVLLPPISAGLMKVMDPQLGLVLEPGPDAGPGADRARAYIAKVHDKFMAPKGVSLQDENGLTADQRMGKALLVYGTPDTSPLVADCLAAAGITLREDGIDLCGREIPGKDLVLLAALPGLEDQDLPVLVYAARTLDGLPGINGVYHGPTGWVVASRNATGAMEAVATGNFQLKAGSLEIAP